MDNRLDLLLEIPEVMRIVVDPKGQRVVEKVDKLELLHYAVQDKVFFRHDTLLYALDKALPIFTNSRPSDFLMGKRYVVALNNQHIAFVFSKNVDAKTHGQFEQIVNEYSKLLFANDGHEPEWIGDTVYASQEVADEIHKSNFFAQNVKIETAAEQKKDKAVSEVIGDYLSIGGDWLMKGITKAGQVLGEGIRSTSTHIKKMVGKNEKPVVIQKTTVERVKTVNKVTKSITTYTKKQIENAIELAISLGKQAKEELVGTESGKNITENKYFIHAANIGKGMFNMATGIYAGLENAFTSVADGTKGTTESVLEHKYGPQVKEVFAHSTETAWEIYGMQNVVKKQALRGVGRAIDDELNGQTKKNSLTGMPTNQFGQAAPYPPQPQSSGGFNMNAK